MNEWNVWETIIFEDIPYKIMMILPKWYYWDKTKDHFTVLLEYNYDYSKLFPIMEEKLKWVNVKRIYLSSLTKY